MNSRQGVDKISLQNYFEIVIFASQDWYNLTGLGYFRNFPIGQGQCQADVA